MRKISGRIGIFIVALIGNIFIYRTVTMKKVKQVLQRDVAHSTELVIRGKSVDIKLLPSENDKIHVALTGKATKHFAEQTQVNIQEVKGVLIISLKKADASNKKNLLRIFEQGSLKLQIKIPQKQWQKMMLETTSGDVYIHDLNVDELVMHSHSGDFRLQQLVTHQLTITNRSGDLTLKNITATDVTTKLTSGSQTLTDITMENSQLQATSGDVKMTHVVGENTFIETTSGTTELTLAEPHQQMSISSTSGDVSINYEQKIFDLKIISMHKSGDVSIKVDDAIKEGAETIIGAGSNVLTVKTTSGTFKLRN